MKFTLVLLFVFSTSVFSRSNMLDVFNTAYEKKMYYTAYSLMKVMAKSRKYRIDLEQVYTVLDHIHYSVFFEDKDLDSRIFTKSDLRVAKGLRLYALRKYKRSAALLRRVRKDNPMKPEADYFLADIYSKYNKLNASNKFFSDCAKNLEKKDIQSFKDERYSGILKNRCLQRLARNYFEQGNYKKQTDVLTKIKNTDYIWPRLILERSWGYYWQGDYPKSLGGLIVFQNPLLKRFYVPEINYLRALIYFEHCYFEKAEQIYKDYEKYDWRFSSYMGEKLSFPFLYNLMKSKKEPSSKAKRFLYYYLKGYKKDIPFISFERSFKVLRNEVTLIRKMPKSRLRSHVLKKTHNSYKVLKKRFANYLESIVNDYRNQVSETYQRLVSLKLAIGSKRRRMKRQGLGKSKGFIELPLSKMKNLDDKFIWDFRNGFWADEIGDFSIALGNRCTSKK